MGSNAHDWGRRSSEERPREPGRGSERGSDACFHVTGARENAHAHGKSALQSEVLSLFLSQFEDGLLLSDPGKNSVYSP